MGKIYIYIVLFLGSFCFLPVFGQNVLQKSPPGPPLSGGETESLRKNLFFSILSKKLNGTSPPLTRGGWGGALSNKNDSLKKEKTNRKDISKIVGHFGAGFNFYGGFVWAHRPFLAAQEAHIWGLEVLLFRQEGVKNESGRLYKAPRFGVGLIYTNLGNDTLNGHCVGIIPHFEFRLFRSRNNASRIMFRLGAGIGIFTKPFDPVTNYRNKMIGSRITGAMQFFFLYTQRLYKQIELQFGVGLTHYSNGNTGIPNYGINMPNFQLGLNYHFQPSAKENEKPIYELKPIVKKNCWQVHAAIGFKQANEVFPKTYVTGTFTAAYYRRLGRRSKLGGGFDLFYDKTNYWLKNKGTDFEEPPMNQRFDLGFKIGHDLMIGKISLVTQFGVYVYSPTYANKYLYQRLGVKYDFYNRFYAGVFLKTHMAAADYIEWAIGANF